MEDVQVTPILLGEFTKTTQMDGLHNLKGCVAKFQDTMHFEGLKLFPFRISTA